MANEKTKTRVALVADDDHAVRGIARRILEREGCRVLEAADGEAALRLAREHPGPIHLLLTDVVMPGLTGPELAERLVSIRPRIKVVYMSGSLVLEAAQAEFLKPGEDFIQKPFSPDDLVRKARESFDEVGE